MTASTKAPFTEYYTNVLAKEVDHIYSHMTQVYPRLKADPLAWKFLTELKSGGEINYEDPGCKAAEGIILDDYDGHSGFSFGWTVRTLARASKSWIGYLEIVETSNPKDNLELIKEGDFETVDLRFYRNQAKSIKECAIMDRVYATMMTDQRLALQRYLNLQKILIDLRNRLSVFSKLNSTFEDQNPDMDQPLARTLHPPNKNADPRQLEQHAAIVDRFGTFLATNGTSLNKLTELDTFMKSCQEGIRSFENAALFGVESFEMRKLFLNVIQNGWDSVVAPST